MTPLKTLFRLALIAAFALHLPVSAAETNTKPAKADKVTPRLWEVTARKSDGSEGKFYLLGITHLGVDAEYDSYLDTTILPRFMEADVLDYEAAPNIYVTDQPCATPWPQTPENAALLQEARRRAKTLLLQANTAGTQGAQGIAPEILDHATQTMVDKISELGLVTLIKDTTLAGAAPHTAPALWHGQVTRYLLQHRSDIPQESVDTQEEYHDAYCGMNAQRPKLFREWIRDDRFDKIPKLPPHYTEHISQTFSRSVETGKLMAPFATESAEAEREFVCKRSANWLPKMQANLDRGVYFYALGFGHFVPAIASSGGKAQCAGLLNDLRAAGMTVKLIK